MKKSLFILTCTLLLVINSKSTAYSLTNPALTPVKIQKTPDHTPLKLVENGKLKFAIITDKKAEYRHGKSIQPAIALLQEAFKNCCGTVPEVFDISKLDKAKKYPYQLLVGQSKLTKKLGMDALKLPAAGFEVKSFSDGIAIVGHDSSLIKNYNPTKLDKKGHLRGTLWGAYDFIERFLGCRFYFPGKYGSLWPKTANLTINPVNYTDYPRFATRFPGWITWTMRGKKNKEKWEPYLGKFLPKSYYPDKVRFTDRWRLDQTTPFHATHDPRPDLFLKRFPKEKDTIFYRSPNGNLYYNAKAHIGNYLDVTNLKLADLMVEALKEYYASEGKVKCGWGYSPNNTYINFGNCDTGLPLPDVRNHPIVKKYNLITEEHIKRGSYLSDVYGRFYQYLGNRLKKELPGKKLVLQPYGGYTQAPLNPKWTLPDNIELRVCLHMFPARTRNPKEVKKAVKYMSDWYKALGNRPAISIYLYHVPASNGSKFARAVAAHFVGEVPKVLGKYLGRNDMFFDQYGGLDWSFYYSDYVAHRSMWNPEFNCDAAIAEHWEPMYGKAAPYLKEFHALLMKNFLEIYVPGTDGNRNPLYPPTDIDKYEDLLKKAEAALEPDSIEMKRFKLFARPWAKEIEAQRNRQGYERPVYGVHQLLKSQHINVDGKGDEPIWNNIKSVKLRDPRGSSTPIAYPPKLKLAWNKNGIYGLAVMPYKPLANPKNSLWRNCNWEIFLSPGLKKSNIYHYAVDAFSNLHLGTQEFKPVDKPYNGNWKSPAFKYAVTTTDKSWTLEFFIPFADMKVSAPSPYDCWLANFVRNKLSEPKEYSGSAMSLGTNKNVDMFGIIKFLGLGD
jgi:hypothetical protein